jgi:hypothetical protein
MGRRIRAFVILTEIGMPENKPNPEPAATQADLKKRRVIEVEPGLFIVENPPTLAWEMDYFAPPQWLPPLKKSSEESDEQQTPASA